MATIGITGPASFVSVGLQFYQHWQEVNTGLGSPTAIELAGALVGQGLPVTSVAFKIFYDQLIVRRTEVSMHMVDLDLERGSLEDLKRALIVRVDQFHKAVRGNAPGSRYERSLPALAQLDDTATVFTEAMVRIRQLWTALNGDASLGVSLPVTLQGNFALADFVALLGGTPGANPNDPPVVPGLRDRYEKVTELEGTVRLDRETRNDLQEKLYGLMKAYRQVLPQKLTAGNALLDSLPALTPPQGSPPPAVVMVVTYDVAQEKARVEVQGPVPAGVTELEVRGVPGMVYSVEDEEVLGSIALGGPLVLLTGELHQQPGQSATYRVYSRNAEGREAGSNTDTVMRPAG